MQLLCRNRIQDVIDAGLEKNELYISAQLFIRQSNDGNTQPCMYTHSGLTCSPSRTVLMLRTGRQSLPRIGIITLPFVTSIFGCQTLQTKKEKSK